MKFVVQVSRVRKLILCWVVPMAYFLTCLIMMASVLMSERVHKASQPFSSLTSSYFCLFLTEIFRV